MNPPDALELIDLHLDHEPLTPEQEAALNDWIRENPDHADQAFRRIFLHTFLRQRLQAELLDSDVRAALTAPTTAEFLVEGSLSAVPSTTSAVASTVTAETTQAGKRALSWRVCWVWGIGALLLGGFLLAAAFREPAAETLYAYEGFHYPSSHYPYIPGESKTWPTWGGLDGLSGGRGWAGPWREAGPKVAIIITDPEASATAPEDMRQSGPLLYIDALGNVLKSEGNQMRTALGRSCLTSRELDLSVYPPSMIDAQGIGADGTVLWVSFMAQSFSSGGRGRYAYLQLGTGTAGLRLGKLASVPSGNWSAAGLVNLAEVNLRSSALPSGEAAFLVARVTFRAGREQVEVWINPRLDVEPDAMEATLLLDVPDFRFREISVASRYSTDIDEIRIGRTYRDVAPMN